MDFFSISEFRNISVSPEKNSFSLPAEIFEVFECWKKDCLVDTIVSLFGGYSIMPFMDYFEKKIGGLLTEVEHMVLYHK